MQLINPGFVKINIFSYIIMAYFTQSLSLTTPFVNTIMNPYTIMDPYVSLVPIVTRIYNEPSAVFYDPFRTVDVLIPTNPYPYPYSYSYPDLNSDVKIQRKVLMNVWNKLESKWIFSYLKVFNYIKKNGSSYELVDSLKESETKTSTIDIEDKADWLLSNYYKKSNLAATIEKFRAKTNLNWWDVDTNAHIGKLEDFIYNQIRRKIMNELS